MTRRQGLRDDRGSELRTKRRALGWSVMTGSSFSPTLTFFSALSAAPLRPLHTLVRTTGERFRPALVTPHAFKVSPAQARVLESGSAGPGDGAAVLCETGAGRGPTIVLGGLVPDSSEQVFLLRRFLLKSGDVYYINYPRAGFSLDLVCAQLSDLVAELNAAERPPVVFAVSFGAGILLEWLRRVRAEGAEPALGGIVMISPVTCVADLIAPGAAKPATLLGRALRPFLQTSAPVTEATVEKARTVFLRMFEAGAQNKQALRLLMTARETERLHSAVMSTIRGVTWQGANQRVQALAAMRAPTEYFSPVSLPLSSAPALALFAENETAVLDAAAPVRLAFEHAIGAYFPNGTVKRVKGNAVQHASLIFHVFEFLPPLQAFYQRVRRNRAPALAA